jgi:protein-arginine kinase activator protein McsA
MIETYTLSEDQKAITCKRCKLTSYNPHDVEHRFCGHCHTFHDDIYPPAREWWLIHNNDGTLLHGGLPPVGKESTRTWLRRMLLGGIRKE